MTLTLELAVTIAAALFAALAGGLYFTFWAIILPALRGRPADEAIAMMQRINVAAVRPPFMVVFFGGAVSCIAVLITQLVATQVFADGIAGTVSLRTIGAALALTGFVITIVRNGPLNTGLAVDSPNTTTRWIQFDRSWGRANSIRSAASITGTIALTASLAGG